MHYLTCSLCLNMRRITYDLHLCMDNVFRLVEATVYVRSHFLYARSTKGEDDNGLQPTSTPISVLNVVSICCEQSKIGRTADINKAAYQEALDALLQRLHTSRYFSCITICAENASQ